MRTFCTTGIVCLLLVFHSATLTAQSTNVLTWHNDNWRTGRNTFEKTLTTTNVTKTTFGKICSAAVDSGVNAQPLIVTGVPFMVGGVTTTHDIAYVVTENDSVYAFDANNCALLNSASVVPVIVGCNPGVTCEQPVDCKSVGAGGCGTIAPTVGILSTPVIDATAGVNGTTGTIYLVAETQVGAGAKPSAWYHRIHALDITNLSEISGSPAIIQGSVPPTATFVSQEHIQRPGLLLLKGVGPNGDNVVYAAFSLMDGAPSRLGHKPAGWVFGYDTTNLGSQPAGLPYVFTSTPNGVGPNGPGGGIWQDGAGLASGLASATDTTPYIYFGTGDGTWDAGTGGSDYADSFLKLTPTLQVSGFFTRFNEPTYAKANSDFGSGGTMLVPDNAFAAHPYLAITAAKDGNIYVIDRGSPGGYNSTTDPNVQTVTGKWPFFSTPAIWNQHLYYTTLGGFIKAYTMKATCKPGPVCTTGLRYSKVQFAYGATPSVSSNGIVTGTPIVWAIEEPNQVTGGAAAILYAFDALTMTELYDTNQCGTQDTAGFGLKFTVPTIANGKVYVGTQNELDVYGGLSTRTCP